MKIYFTAAISDIPADHQDNYRIIVDTLKRMGHQVIAEHILGKTTKDLAGQSEEEQVRVFKKLITWKHQSELVIVEASYPSFGVGQEISYSLTHNKPVIALHLAKNKPNLLQAINPDYLYIVEYTLRNLKRVLADYIDYAKETVDTRFNFFISSEIEAFLDWISKEKKVPRAVFLRQLIEDDLKKNRKYLKDTGQT
jgi:hypothetical protein